MANLVRLRARALEFGYMRGPQVLDPIDLELESGAMTAITGQSGRGKSTLLYLLGLMLTPTAGDIYVEGQTTSVLRDAPLARLRAEMYGFVFQDAALDPARTVLDNVLEPLLYKRSPPADAAVRARRLLQRFGVEARADARPGQISGGQAQRIALCRAIIGSPQILIADEPTGNLDDESSSLVMDAFKEQAQSGVCVIVATDDPRVSSSCDRVIAL